MSQAASQRVSLGSAKVSCLGGREALEYQGITQVLRGPEFRSVTLGLA